MLSRWGLAEHAEPQVDESPFVVALAYLPGSLLIFCKTGLFGLHELIGRDMVVSLTTPRRRPRAPAGRLIDMAFESKRLRVQLPCGDTSVHEHEARRKPTGIFRPTCTAVGSLPINPTCGPQGSFACYWCTHTVTGTLCGAIGSLDYDRESEDPLIVDVDQLPLIRAQLELQLKQLDDQLKEVEAAEVAVAEREAEA